MNEPRTHPIWDSEPIKPETYEKLIAMLEREYPGRVRRAVDVRPVAINKTIDNEADAQETMRRIVEAQGFRLADRLLGPDAAEGGE